MTLMFRMAEFEHSASMHMLRRIQTNGGGFMDCGILIAKATLAGEPTCHVSEAFLLAPHETTS